MLITKYFTTPTVEQVETEYKGERQGRPRGNREILTDRLHQYFGDILGQILQGLVEMPAELGEKAIALAQEFAAARYDHCAWINNPHAALGVVRLSEIVRHPMFPTSSFGVDLIRALKDMRYNHPWGFEMYHRYERDRGYFLVPGIGPNHVDGFRRFVEDDELWTGDRETNRIFFASVAKALASLSKEQGLVVETMPVRMELMARNKKHGDQHEPWCNASVRPDELIELGYRAKTDEEVRSMFERIFWEGMVLTPHGC